jgi:P4 family phage/plasmid primase-like protien
MQNFIQKYYDQEIFTFTFEGLIADTNDKGKVVKKCIGMPQWKSINKKNFQDYVYDHHRGLAVLTGNMSNITCIDFDIREEYEKLVEKHPELKSYYTVQTNKGFHIYCKYNAEIKTTTNAMNSYSGVDIRNDDAILYAPPTKYKVKDTCAMVEYKFIGGDILEFPDYLFNDLKQNNRKTEETQAKIRPLLQAQQSPPPPPTPPLPPPRDPMDALTDDQIKNNKLKELEKLKILSTCYKRERISNYDSYFKLTMAIKNSFGDMGKFIWDEICSRGDNYDHNKNTEQWYKYTAKTKEDKLLKFGSLVKWAKDDNPTLYNELFGKQIIWDLSEAEYSKALKRVCFDNSHVLFTGKGKEPEGYLYNGVYWVDLSLHNAELKQKHFDNLYKFYTDALEQEKNNLEETTYKSLMGQIKTLNTNKTRTNILKIFQADNYVADVEWNKNKNLFVFENCVYNLETNKFVESNPDEYINTSCGYRYDDRNKNEFEKAKQKIKQFVDSILLENDREYVWTLMGSSVVQSNAEEKAYFLLGIGRNGKGTLIKPFKNSLGKYWGDLNMNYYTTHDKGADTPNQNLYNCRNSRVVSSVEVSDSDSQNRAVKFVSDKFKTLSGNDTIYARELGTKNSAYFQAGKPFIQTNVMPVFTKLDTSLKERIVVINFPYTFKYEDEIDENNITHKLIDVTLKNEFDKEIYKSAMISILFDYYKKYKDLGLIIPQSVKAYTKSYFASSSIKSWIDDNLDPTEHGSIDLKEILRMYEEASDKKMTVKQLKSELEEFGYEVKRGVSGFVLKHWKEKIIDYENEVSIQIDNIEFDE